MNFTGLPETKRMQVLTDLHNYHKTTGTPPAPGLVRHGAVAILAKHGITEQEGEAAGLLQPRISTPPREQDYWTIKP